MKKIWFYISDIITCVLVLIVSITVFTINFFHEDSSSTILKVENKRSLIEKEMKVFLKDAYRPWVVITIIVIVLAKIIF